MKLRYVERMVVVSGKKKKKGRGKPPLDREAMVDRLEWAKSEGLHVYVRRWIRHADLLGGYVTGIGREWLCLACADSGLKLDGWQLVRLKDIQAVRVDFDPECLEGRVLRARGQWPPPVVDVGLDSGADAIRTVGARGMTSLFSEFADPDMCWVGLLDLVDQRTARLQGIDPRGYWDREPRLYDVEDVTRLQFGGGYEESLALVAGPVPDRG